MVAQTAGSAVCGFSMIAGACRGPQTRRSALHQNRGNKARMSMKTKDKYKMSLRLTAPDQASVTRPWSADRKAAVDSSSSGLLDFSIAKSGEQSENVYENKRQVQNVAEQGSVSGLGPKSRLPGKSATNNTNLDCTNTLGHSGCCARMIMSPTVPDRNVP